jgi:hypothetical protein
MREIFTFTVPEAMPPETEVLESQGMPERDRLPQRITILLDEAMRVFTDLSEPRGLLQEASTSEFEDIYRGEGFNADETPLESVYPQAEALALFAATLGEPVSGRISTLFAENDPALAYMLDAIASVSADRLATLLGGRLHRRLGHDGIAVLPYSPGYCGWHISAQRKLFERLRPEEIGIRLNDTCLMQPLKSVSGVLVAGPAQIHKFRPRFSFCEECRTRTCAERMASISR